MCFIKSPTVSCIVFTISLLIGCGASEQTRVSKNSRTSRTVEVNFTHHGSARIIMGKRRFILILQKGIGVKIKAVAYSPKGKEKWAHTLPCSGRVYQGNESHFVCRDEPSNTLIGVKTANGEISWKTRIKGEIRWMDSYHDEMIIQLENKKTTLISTKTGALVRKAKPLPEGAYGNSTRVGKYLVSEPALLNSFKTNFLVTRLFKGRKHIRTDYGIDKPIMHMSVKEGIVGYGHLRKGRWALGLMEPQHHRLLWSNAWPHKVEPRSMFVRSEAGVIVWNTSNHWAAYSVKDGTYLGGGVTAERKKIVAGYGAVAKLSMNRKVQKSLIIQPLRVSKNEQRKVKAMTKQAPEQWLFGPGALDIMTKRHAGLDLKTGFHEDTDYHHYYLRLKRSSKGIKVNWKLNTDRTPEHDEYLIRKGAYEGRGEVNMRLDRLHRGSIRHNESAFIMPKEIFNKAIKHGEATWRVKGASRKLKYLGVTWHSMTHIITETKPVRYKVYTAHLFTSGQSEYRVVLSGDIPVIVSWRSPTYSTTIMGTDQSRNTR